jgi:hypothetical protein
LVAVIEEEALLITRSGAAAHDFEREVLAHVSGAAREGVL